MYDPQRFKLVLPGGSRPGFAVGPLPSAFGESGGGFCTGTTVEASTSTFQQHDRALVAIAWELAPADFAGPFQVQMDAQEAIRQADQGNFDGAAASLREAAAKLEVCESVPAIAEEMQDLVAEAGRLAAKHYEAADRKYYGARAMASRDLKSEYARNVSRKPRK